MRPGCLEGTAKAVSCVQLSRIHSGRPAGKCGVDKSGPAIGTVAVVVRRQVDVATLIGVKIEIQQAALANALGVDALPHGDDPPSHVGPLYAGERQRRGAAHGKRGDVLFPFGGV